MTDDDRNVPPPVEPMSDVAWSRIERGVWNRLDAAGDPPLVASRAARTSRRWWLALPVAAAAIAAVVIAVRVPQHAVAVDDGPTRVVSEASSTTVSLGDAHIALEPHSAIVMDSRAGAPNVIVERGAAWFAVEPRGARPPFVVIAGDTRVRVIGTRFLVARDAEHVEVTVNHGTVEVGYHGSLVHVTADQHWSSDTPGEITTGPIAAAAASPAPAVAPAPAAGPSTIEPAPAPDAPAAPPATLEPAPGSGTGSATHRPRTPAAGSAASHADRDAARFAVLTRLEASAPDAAMKGYLALSQGSGRWAAVALYAAARLASDRHDPRATTFLAIYLRRFPNGANAVRCTPAAHPPSRRPTMIRQLAYATIATLGLLACGGHHGTGTGDDAASDGDGSMMFVDAPPFDGTCTPGRPAVLELHRRRR